jgi:DNA-binding NarL/FixJ family response regulator
LTKDYGISISPDGKRLIFSIPIETIFTYIEPVKHRQVPAVRLTPREKEIFALLCKGLVNKEISNALNICERTVKYHLEHIYKKFNLNRCGILQHFGENTLSQLVPQVVQ